MVITLLSYRTLVRMWQHVNNDIIKLTFQVQPSLALCESRWQGILKNISHLVVRDTNRPPSLRPPIPNPRRFIGFNIVFFPESLKKTSWRNYWRINRQIIYCLSNHAIEMLPWICALNIQQRKGFFTSRTCSRQGWQGLYSDL